MAAPRRLVIAPSALGDLGSIHDHIGENNPIAARKQTERIFQRARMLLEFPEMGSDRYRLAPGLRSIVERPYVVFYYPRDYGIEIVRVFHGRQDIEHEMLSFIEQYIRD